LGQKDKRLRSEAVATQTPESQSLTPEETAWLQVPAHADAMATVSARVAKPDVRPDANLDLDLALDSMERVELLTLIEQHGRRSRLKRATIFTCGS
jgi:hypothetical protein